MSASTPTALLHSVAQPVLASVYNLECAVDLGRQELTVTDQESMSLYGVNNMVCHVNTAPNVKALELEFTVYEATELYQATIFNRRVCLVLFKDSNVLEMRWNSKKGWGRFG